MGERERERGGGGNGPIHHGGGSSGVPGVLVPSFVVAPFVVPSLRDAAGVTCLEATAAD